MSDRRLQGLFSHSRARRIGERDSWICGICQLRIDPDYWRSRLGLKFDSQRDNLKPNVDHVIPQSWGGQNGDDNLQIAHAICNLDKHRLPHRPGDEAQQFLAYAMRLTVDRPPQPLSWSPTGGSMRIALEAALQRDELAPEGLYFFGASLSREDPERSEMLSRRAAELGDVRAVKGVGRLLQRRGELDEARQLYRRAIDRDVSGAKVDLALTLKDEDPQQAAELFRGAAEQGSLHGMYCLGLMLYPSDHEAALSWLERAAAGGWPLNRLVDDLGRRDAYKFVRELVERGSFAGMYCLGLMLYLSNREVAFSLLERAAAGGQRQARSVLSLPEPRRTAHLVHLSQRLLQLPRSQHGHESDPQGPESSVTQT